MGVGVAEWRAPANVREVIGRKSQPQQDSHPPLSLSLSSCRTHYSTSRPRPFLAVINRPFPVPSPVACSPSSHPSPVSLPSASSPTALSAPRSAPRTPRPTRRAIRRGRTPGEHPFHRKLHAGTTRHLGSGHGAVSAPFVSLSVRMLIFPSDAARARISTSCPVSPRSPTKPFRPALHLGDTPARSLPPLLLSLARRVGDYV